MYLLGTLTLFAWGIVLLDTSLASRRRAAWCRMNNTGGPATERSQPHLPRAELPPPTTRSLGASADASVPASVCFPETSKAQLERPKQRRGYYTRYVPYTCPTHRRRKVQTALANTTHHQPQHFLVTRAAVARVIAPSGIPGRTSSFSSWHMNPRLIELGRSAVLRTSGEAVLRKQERKKKKTLLL